MCCGGKNTTKPVSGGGAAKAAMRAAATANAAGGSSMVQMVYRGPRKGDFQIVSGVTRTRYRIPGQGEFVVQTDSNVRGVIPSDVAWFRSVGQGQHFQVVEPPRPAPAITAAPVQGPVPVANPDSEAWAPATMESAPLPEGDKSGRKSRAKSR